MSAPVLTPSEGTDELVLEWDQNTGQLVPAANAGGTLLVAESWLIDNGAVRAIERHWQRFAHGCAEATHFASGALTKFWTQTLAAMPRAGRWFPRIEVAHGPEQRMRLRLRPAPTTAGDLRVWISDSPDPRLFPQRKGPDLQRLLDLRERAAEHGAEEALITTLEGTVIEGARSSVMWWEGDRLCFPARDLPLLPAVTSKLVREIAGVHGHPVAYRRVNVSDLDGREVWFTSALNGIRPVTEWVGAPIKAGAAVRAEQWRTILDRLALPLPETKAVWR
ncbi:aminotransferase class IV [Saccharopolyspora taberi]|uniref:Aminotransferase class IV n=1 Tax=Saccharopolyspora taberi TaxID=60895 RepID=A0ABN3V6U0_9PSEU